MDNLHTNECCNNIPSFNRYSDQPLQGITQLRCEQMVSPQEASGFQRHELLLPAFIHPISHAMRKTKRPSEPFYQRPISEHPYVNSETTIARQICDTYGVSTDYAEPVVNNSLEPISTSISTRPSRFMIADEPNSIQRKSYKSENRYFIVF